MKLLIICRGLLHEGLGHLFRAKSFAAHAATRHETKIIAITHPETSSVFSDAYCPVHVVEQENKIPPMVESFQPDVVLFDLLSLEKNLCEKICALTKLTVSLSPIFDQMNMMSLVFSRTSLPDHYPHPKMYTGLEYTIFGHRCEKIPERIYQQQLNQQELSIGVAMGGADAANKTLKVLDALAEVKKTCTIWALLGEGYSHSYDALVEAGWKDRKHEIILAKTKRSTWKLLGGCTLGILAGGLTTLEAIYVGLPTINLSEKSFHSKMMQELFRMGVCLDGGAFTEESLQGLITVVDELNENRKRLNIMRQATFGLLNMDGPERVLGKIEYEFTNA